MTKFTKLWLKAACIRAVRTFAQTLAAFLTAGAALSDINWQYALSVSAVALIYSVLTSIITTLPEAQMDGTLVIDDTNKEKTNYLFEVDTPLDDVAGQKTVTLNVEVHK